jgi:hypothetical protein
MTKLKYLAGIGAATLLTMGLAVSAVAQSGEQTSRIELGDFLTRGYGAEQQALVQMIGTLIESIPGELLTGEGNPGLAVSGGSGHA